MLRSLKSSFALVHIKRVDFKSYLLVWESKNFVSSYKGLFILVSASYKSRKDKQKWYWDSHTGIPKTIRTKSASKMLKEQRFSPLSFLTFAQKFEIRFLNHSFMIPSFAKAWRKRSNLSRSWSLIFAKVCIASR